MKNINNKYCKFIFFVIAIIYIEVSVGCNNQKRSTLKEQNQTYLNLSRFNIYLYLMEDSKYTSIGDYDDEVKVNSWLYESKEGNFNVIWNKFEDSTLRFNIPESWILDKKYTDCSFTDTLTDNTFIFLRQKLAMNLIDYLSDYYTSVNDTIIEKKATKVIVNDNVEFIVLEFKLKKMRILATLIKNNSEIFEITFIDNTNSEKQKIIYAEIINTISIKKEFIIPNQTDIKEIIPLEFE